MTFLNLSRLKKVIVFNLIVFLIFPSLVRSYTPCLDPPAPVLYCESFGYRFIQDKGTDCESGWPGICDFGDGNSCDVYEFYNKKCGQNYIKEKECIKKGGIVSNYQKCCFGLAPSRASIYNPIFKCDNYFVALYNDYKFSFISNPILTLIHILVRCLILVLIVFAIFLIIKKIRKKYASNTKFTNNKQNWGGGNS